MARKRRVGVYNAGELNLTAMIDVAFQLLSFFVITSHPVDVLTNLDVTRPAAAERQKDDVDDVNLLKVMVHKTGYAVNGVPVTIKNLENALSRIAQTSTKITVIVISTGDATHGQLVAALDVCNKLKLQKIALMSL
jgi:biopolymer transport protein ExbD